MRLKSVEDEKKIGIWQWDKVGFAGSREWNGLRVHMALIDNWDLKDVNNSVYRKASQSICMVSDLGAYLRIRRQLPGRSAAPRTTLPPTGSRNSFAASGRTRSISKRPGGQWFCTHRRPQGLLQRASIWNISVRMCRAPMPGGWVNFLRDWLRPRFRTPSVPQVILHKKPRHLCA